MSNPEDDHNLIQEAAEIAQKGKWFRQTGRGFWHLEAHQEYGVIWSLCGVRLRLSQTQETTLLDPEAGDVECARCATKARMGG